MYARLGLRLLFISSLLLTVCGCKSKKEETQNPKETTSGKAISPISKLDKVKSLFGAEVIYYDENYKFDSTNKIISVILTQKKNKINYGIKFITANLNADSIIIINQSEFLDGVEEMSSFGSVNLGSSNHKLLYYDSKTSFLGSGGGDVYVYLYNPQDGLLFSAQAIFTEGESKIQYSKHLKDKTKSIYKDWLTNQIFQTLPEFKELKFKEEFSLE